MIKYVTKKVAMLTIFSFLIGFVFLVKPTGKIYAAYSIPSEAEFVNKLNLLRKQYPNGGKWSGVYYEDGTAKAWECFGYANQMMYEVFGAWFYAEGLMSYADYTMGTLYAGDWVRIVTYGEPNNHSIFITKVTNDRVYFTDGNWDGNNGIRWDASYSKSELSAIFSYKIHLPGNTLSGNGVADNKKPSISSFYYSMPSTDGFRLVCVANDNVGIESVKFATWTTGNQSDVKWTEGNFNGYSAWWVDRKFADFSSTVFVSHVYVYDYAGNYSLKELVVYPDRTAPSITDCTLSNVTDQGFNLICNVSDNKGVTKVQAATWCTNNQSDIIWRDAEKLENGSWSVHISYNEQLLNPDVYITHLFAYDAWNNECKKEILTWKKDLNALLSSQSATSESNISSNNKTETAKSENVESGIVSETIVEPISSNNDTTGNSSNDTENIVNKHSSVIQYKKGIYKITKSTNSGGTVAFLGTTNKRVASITIPATMKIDGRTYKVTSVKEGAFANNIKIKSIVIGKNVKKIGKNAFYGCGKLKTLVLNANTVVDVETNAIKGISKKAVIKVPKKLYKKYKKEFSKKTGFKSTMTLKKK